MKKKKSPERFKKKKKTLILVIDKSLKIKFNVFFKCYCPNKENPQLKTEFMYLDLFSLSGPWPPY